MKEFQIFSKSLNKKKPEIDYTDKKVISFSQISSFNTCPKRWELNYIKRIKDEKPSIHLVFGQAFHATLQYLIFLYYKKSVKLAKEFNYTEFLTNEMRSEYLKMMEKYGKHFSTPSELSEFTRDGIEILKYFTKKRNLYFNTRNYELIGIEVPLFLPIVRGSKRTIVFMGYVDLILRDKRTDEYILFDIKTSTRGWNSWKKKDKLATAQLILYKKFFAEQYGVDIEKIKIQYFIVKRKIDEESEWPQKRIQEFTPADGKVSVNRALKYVDNFVDFSFDKETGDTYKDKTYMAIKGERDWNCRFCIFNEQYDLCPKENRV